MEAQKKILGQLEKQISEVTDPAYIHNLREVIQDANEAKAQYNAKLASLKSDYPMLYKTSKM